MIRKMEKKIYVAPRLEVLPLNVKPILGSNYKKIGDNEKGSFLSREINDNSSPAPNNQNKWDDFEDYEE